jgi:hypothetical protein
MLPIISASHHSGSGPFALAGKKYGGGFGLGLSSLGMRKFMWENITPLIFSPGRF